MEHMKTTKRRFPYVTRDQLANAKREELEDPKYVKVTLANGLQRWECACGVAGHWGSDNIGLWVGMSRHDRRNCQRRNG